MSADADVQALKTCAASPANPLYPIDDAIVFGFGPPSGPNGAWTHVPDTPTICDCKNACEAHIDRCDWFSWDPVSKDCELATGDTDTGVNPQFKNMQMYFLDPNVVAPVQRSAFSFALNYNIFRRPLENGQFVAGPYTKEECISLCSTGNNGAIIIGIEHISYGPNQQPMDVPSCWCKETDAAEKHTVTAFASGRQRKVHVTSTADASSVASTSTDGGAVSSQSPTSSKPAPATTTSDAPPSSFSQQSTTSRLPSSGNVGLQNGHIPAGNPIFKPLSNSSDWPPPWTSGSKSTSSVGLSGPAIAGIVVGALVVLLAVICVIWFLWWRRRAAKKSPDDNMFQTNAYVLQPFSFVNAAPKPLRNYTMNTAMCNGADDDDASSFASTAFPETSVPPTAVYDRSLQSLMLTSTNLPSYESAMQGSTAMVLLQENSSKGTKKN